VTLWLLLRAFVSGCTAMTGVEASATELARRTTPPKLVISPSPYWSFAGRLLKHLGEIETEYPGRPVLS
jgi:hypothetical protein